MRRALQSTAFRECQCRECAQVPTSNSFTSAPAPAWSSFKDKAFSDVCLAQDLQASNATSEGRACSIVLACQLAATRPPFRVMKGELRALCFSWNSPGVDIHFTAQQNGKAWGVVVHLPRFQTSQ